jgi:hypothetical protein
MDEKVTAYASCPYFFTRNSMITGCEELVGDECEETEVDDQRHTDGGADGFAATPLSSGGKTETAVSATAIQALRLAGMQVALP